MHATGCMCIYIYDWIYNLASWSNQNSTFSWQPGVQLGFAWYGLALPKRYNGGLNISKVVQFNMSSNHTKSSSFTWGQLLKKTTFHLFHRFYILGCHSMPFPPHKRPSYPTIFSRCSWANSTWAIPPQPRALGKIQGTAGIIQLDLVYCHLSWTKAWTPKLCWIFRWRTWWPNFGGKHKQVGENRTVGMGWWSNLWLCSKFYAC